MPDKSEIEVSNKKYLSLNELTGGFFTQNDFCVGDHAIISFQVSFMNLWNIDQHIPGKNVLKKN